jgi:hypothetical protein
MNFDRFAGFLAASFICLILAIVAWSGVAGPIWRASSTASSEQWLGFAGTVLGAVLSSSATLLAAGVALYAAFRTLSPMRSQLAELTKQNDHILYERLRKRALDLNNEIILLQTVFASCKQADSALTDYLAETGLNLSREKFMIAAKTFFDDLGPLRITRGVIWGNALIQIQRNTFVDQSLVAATLVMSFANTAESQKQIAALLIKRELKKWNELTSLVATLGNQLQISANLEIMRIGQAISELEIKLFI